MRPADVAQDNRERQTSTAALSAAIQATHSAVANERDPADKAKLSRALQTLLDVQAGHASPAAAPGGMARLEPHPDSGMVMNAVQDALSQAGG